MEAGTGFEPVKHGVADRYISSLPPSHKKTPETFANRGFFSKEGESASVILIF